MSRVNECVSKYKVTERHQETKKRQSSGRERSYRGICHPQKHRRSACVNVCVTSALPFTLVAGAAFACAAPNHANEILSRSITQSIHENRKCASPVIPHSKHVRVE